MNASTVPSVLLALLLGLPAAAAMIQALRGHRPGAARVNSLVCAATLAAGTGLALALGTDERLSIGAERFSIDALNATLIILTALVGFTTALTVGPYLQHEQQRGRMNARRQRLFYSMYQMFIGMLLLALSTNNLGVLWVAMEAATLATVLLVSVYRSPEGLEAAWKYFILCGVGIAQALFGTLLLYLAADRVIGGGEGALLWTPLAAVKSQLEPNILALAFAFLVLGYGTKVGLVPIHNWLPDAHAEGPTPISAVLSGLLLNVALYAILRGKVLADGALSTGLPGHIMLAFGLLSVLVAAFFLKRQRDAKRLFAYSSIEHMGLMTFSFGLGGPLANFAGLLHMVLHAITKSAIFFSIGHLTQAAGSQLIDDIRGAVRAMPGLSWCLMLGALAILGMPPFGVFASEFLILTSAIHDAPWSVPLLMLALGVAFAAILARVQSMVFGDGNLDGSALAARPNLLPIMAHLAISLMLGLYVPAGMRSLLMRAGTILTGVQGP